MQGTLGGAGKKAATTAIGVLCALAFFTSSAQAAAPQIERTSVSGVTTTTASLEATIDPGGALTRFHFEYGLQDCATGPCTSVPAPEGKIPAEVKGSGDLTGKGPGVSEQEARTVKNVTATAGAFGVGDVITGAGIPAGTTITAVNVAAKTLILSREATASGISVALTATGPQPVSVPVSGLQSATLYHYRVVAKNPAIVEGADHIFATFGQTLEGLPDGRAYEQASPVNKDGGDAQQHQSLTKATPTGDGITFGSAFSMPNGKGAQSLPTFLASRGASNWSSEGLLPPVVAGEPPETVGERARFIGWSPNYSRLYSRAIRLGSPRTEALVEQSGQADPIVVGPYATNAHYYLSGETPSGSVVFFEASVKLPPQAGKPPIAAATEGIPNLYAWDRETGEVSLAGTFNEGEGAPKGSFAGPYDWSLGSSAFNLHEGGAERSYYLQDMHAVTPEGNVYFTAAGSGQLYLRRNPTEPQSPMQSGKCQNPALACTIHVSASKRATPDPAGEAPAAFQAASKDGSQVFFTSHEMLTDNANTGPEQLPPAIARAKSDGSPASVEASFIPERAVGVTRSGPWIYWADPAKGEIGRAKLNAQEELEGTPDDEFIVIPPSEGECEEEPDPSGEPGVFKPIAEPIPAEPRYLSVDAEHIYWTNTGRRDDFDNPRNGGGTIGRAKLNAQEEVEAGSVEPAFICGEEAAQPGERLVSNPQGIAVNEANIYWANAAQDAPVRLIAQATIRGEEVNAQFADPGASRFPYGLALDSTYLYFAADEPQNKFGYISRVPLGGGGPELRFIGEDGVRGVAIDSSGNLYWTTQGEGGWVGHLALGEWGVSFNCATIPSCNPHFIDITGNLNGIAAGADHLFWSTNGESSGNPGNDLYRYKPAGDGTLEDLTPIAGGNGAEVQGVLGASADGSYVYFAANGVFPGTAAEGAAQGDCKGSVKTAGGNCNLYLWHEGQVRFVAPLAASNGPQSDALDWVGTPLEVQNSGSYAPKTALVGEGGAVLTFRSQEQLTAYDNEGVPEFYRYRASEPGKLSCLTCPPSGEAVSEGPRLGSRTTFPQIEPIDEVQAVQSRNLSADGSRFFFQTSESLAPTDTDEVGDVYEWEAPGSPDCQESSPSYSPLNEGCIYLISTGKSEFPSFFGDASEDGSSVFFFTRQQLVGQDQDELQDVYDARVGGGLAAQNQILPPPCESGEACHGPTQSPPAEGSPATPNFSGPGNVSEKHKKPKAKQHKKKQKHHKKKHKQQGAKAGGGR
jgi:hypothetical protein